MILEQTQQPNNSPGSILVTVDLEDWFQVENLRPAFPLERWDSCELRVEKGTHVLLDLFDRHSVKATFFVLGWLAERNPGLIKDIKTRGHEIASHGYMHVMCGKVGVGELRELLYRSKSVLEDVIAAPVTGYRAANFSITRDLIGLLGELKFEYDSSYNDFALNRRHGQAGGLFRSSATGQMIADNGIVELPVSNLRVGGLVLPWSGGGYFRLWPSPLFERGVSRILKHESVYMFYCHPWEFDADQPRVKDIGKLSRLRHYLNIEKTGKRLDRFLKRFNGYSFVTCGDYIKQSTLK